MNAADTKLRLAERAEQFVRELLPAGRKHGDRWIIGSLLNQRGQSCRVYLSGARVGVFCDFATGERGSNLVELYRQIHNVEFTEALRQCREWLNR